VLVLALRTNIELSLAQPVFLIATSFTDKTVRPFLLEQILVTGAWI
jgi:hypothetical protein